MKGYKVICIVFQIWKVRKNRYQNSENGTLENKNTGNFDLLFNSLYLLIIF